MGQESGNRCTDTANMNKTEVKYNVREYPEEKFINILKNLSNKKEVLTDDESKALATAITIMECHKDRFKSREQFREKHGVYESE